MDISGEDKRTALTILQWLAYSARPVTVEEFREAIYVKLDNQCIFDAEERLMNLDHILEICPSLIMKSNPNDNGSTLRFAHYSVKEYLISERIWTGKCAEYGVLESTSNQIIAKCCLGYLLHCCKQSAETTATLRNYPLGGYAARHWGKHTRQSEREAPEISQLAMSLLYHNKESFENFCRIYPLTFDMEGSIPPTVSSPFQHPSTLRFHVWHYGNTLSSAR